MVCVNMAREFQYMARKDSENNGGYLRDLLT